MGNNLVIVGGAETVVVRERGYRMMVEGSRSRAKWNSSTKEFGSCGVEGRGTRCTKVGV